MLTYSHARELMASARNPERGKPLANNTRLFDRGEFYAVQLHATDVVEIYPNGTWGLRHNGWTTPTTSDRIRNFSPANYTTWLSEGDGFGGSNWWVYFNEDPDDPRPPRRERTIPKPFHAPDPGPEPVKAEEGCVAGQLHAKGVMASEFLRSIEELQSNDRIKVYGDWQLDAAPNRAHAVVRYLSRVGRYGAIHVERPGVELIEYGTFAHGWQARDERKRPTWKYEQCPHCAAFAQLHGRWNALMNGDPYARTRRGYAQMCEWLETFGSREGWQAQYIAEFRRVREAKRLLREWTERNRFDWTNGVIVIDANGELTKKCSDERRKADRARRRRERAAERAEERRAIEQRKREREAAQLERFKARIRAQRGEGFTALARQTANSLASLAQHLDTPTDELESCDV